MRNSSFKSIIIASPHQRNDEIVNRLIERFVDRKIVRVHSPSELSNDLLEHLDPEWIFFPHWSWIIPEEIYVKYTCIIFHMTDLPYGRGGSPLQNLIVRGHKETKLSALKCVSEIDAGPIYLKYPLSLAGTAEDILFRASGVIVEMISEILQTQLEPIPQVGDVVNFKRRKPQDGCIAELDTLSEVYDYIRMLDGNGYPRAFIEVSNMHIEFSGAQLSEDFVEAKVRIRRIIND